jgi:thioredoxin
LTDRSFDAFMRDYPGPIVAEFWASWCPHCLRFAPIVREAAAELAGKCAVVQINSEENPGLASRFAIQGIPALLFLRKGEVIDRVGGALAKGALLDWCRRHLR